MLREVQALVRFPSLGSSPMDKLAFGMRSSRPCQRFLINSVSITRLSEAAKPIHEADRHAKKDLKALVRDIRPVERLMEAVLAHQPGITPAYMRGLSEEEACIVQDYCLAARSALTDDGQPPLCAAGLRLQERLTKIAASLRASILKGG